MFFNIPRSWFITGFVTRLTRRMSLVEQELPTHPEHLSSSPIFSGVRVTRSLVLCVCFVYSCLSFCPFSFDRYVFCPSSIYRIWLSFCYLQTLLVTTYKLRVHYGIKYMLFSLHSTLLPTWEDIVIMFILDTVVLIVLVNILVFKL